MTASRLSVTYISVVIIAGTLAISHGLLTWQSVEPGKYLSYLLIALTAATLKIRLPSVTGTMSVSFLFVLIGVAGFSIGETLLMGCGGALVQSLFHAKNRPRPEQVLFNLGSAACAIEVAWFVHQAPWIHSPLLTAAAYFLANTLSVTIIIALTEHKSAWAVWRESYFWSFPNYLVGAAVVWIVGVTDRLLGWQAALFLFPVLFLLYRSHRTSVERLEEALKQAEQEGAHAREVAAMHRRTIETLALAVEAKDQGTHDHLKRVEIYAIAVATELGFGEAQIAELRAAALLHDIGKLVVPEHIIAKPGKLTREEFAQMKTHTVVGAAIVERMKFPYEVAPIVRGHHEKWDGTGYPDGLAGEEIPIGARIMAAVDCLDALSSERPYRIAMSLAEAIEEIKSQAGMSFDPQIVEVLARRFEEREALVANAKGIEQLPVAVQVERGNAPATGFETLAVAETTRDLSALSRAVGGNLLAAADMLAPSFEHANPSAVVFEKLSRSLHEVVSWDAMAVYARTDGSLLPIYFAGAGFGAFLCCPISLGAGVYPDLRRSCRNVRILPDVGRGRLSRNLMSTPASLIAV